MHVLLLVPGALVLLHVQVSERFQDLQQAGERVSLANAVLLLLFPFVLSQQNSYINVVGLSGSPEYVGCRCRFFFFFLLCVCHILVQ